MCAMEAELAESITHKVHGDVRTSKGDRVRYGGAGSPDVVIISDGAITQNNGSHVDYMDEPQ